MASGSWLGWAASLIFAGLLTLGTPARTWASSSRVRDVCATCPYRTIQAALDAASPGDTISVKGGSYPGPLVVTKSVDLEGSDGAVIEGSNHGTVVHITAPDVVFRGFIVRDSGQDYDREDTGILVDGARARIENNQVLNDLFGIELHQAPDSLIANNHVVGMALDQPLRGDGIKVWYSPRVQVIGNHVENSRDCLMWFSDNATVRDNSVSGGRYGFHFMYGNGSLVEHNWLDGNSVGIYLMYGKNMTIRGNRLSGNRGPSGDGIGLKEVDGASVEDNLIVDNRVGVYVDNSPLSPGVFNYFRRNVIAYNDEGLDLLPLDQNSVFSRNDLIDNVEQVAVLGGGSVGHNAWTEGGVGNFWSDYVGYDGNGDGIGDIPYRAAGASEQILDRQPLLQIFRFSTALGAIDFAARTFPSFEPDPKLVDSAPLTSPVPVGDVPRQSVRSSLPATVGAFGLLMICGVVLIGSRFWTGPRRSERGQEIHERRKTDMIEVQHLTKSYGNKAVIRDVSFSVQPGESLALWGPNGVGKTTILRCLLGLTRYEGEIRIGGLSPSGAGTEVRQQLGYVPQEMLAFDLEVASLASFIGDLRGASTADVARRLDQFGLTPVLYQSVATLSGGMKQKLALALALIGDPPVLLLDEPTANLDAKSQAELLNLLLDLKGQGRSILFTSHRWSEVMVLADRVIQLAPVSRPEEVDLTESRLISDHNLTLRVRLGANELDRAHEALVEHGYAARRNGTSVYVQVAGDRKAEPLVLLSQLGCPVVDFDLEDHQ